MGIITGPGYELFGDDNSCWAAGHTPKKLYCTFSQIIPGPGWYEQCGPPCNGTFLLEQSEYRIWTSSPDLWVNIVFRLYSTYSQLTAFSQGPYTHFFQAYLETCVFRFENAPDLALQIFKGGFGQITEREPTDVLASIQTTCELMGVPAGKKVYGHISINQDQEKTIRLARQRDGTCVRIKLQ